MTLTRPPCDLYAPGKLVLAEDEHLAAEFGDDLALVLGASVLEHVLDDIVAVLILDEALRVLMQLLQDGRGLLAGTVLQYALDHAAAVRVRRQREHLNRPETQS